MVIDTNLPSDNSLRFKKNVLGTKQKLILTIDDEIKDEKLLYDIKKEATKISALLSGKIDKYEYLTGEEILPSDQSRIKEQADFTYSSLGKAFEKQNNGRAMKKANTCFYKSKQNNRSFNK